MYQYIMVDAVTTQNIKSISNTELGPNNKQLQGAELKKAQQDSRSSSMRDQSFIKELNELPKVQELKSMPVLNTASNFLKKNTSRLFKVGGFMGASLSIVTYFLFNLKSLAMIFGIPTAMSFYIAHSLSKSLDKESNEFSTNPHQILKDAVENPGKLETNLSTVLQAVEQIKDMKDSHHMKDSGIKLIEDLNIIVDAKLQQLEGFEDQSTVALKGELDRFKIAYDEMKASQVASDSDQAELDEPEFDPIKEMHKQ